jgi:hypothetical protein
MGLVHVNTLYPSPNPSSISSEERVENIIHSGPHNDVIKVPVPLGIDSTTINHKAPVVSTQDTVQSIDDEPINSNDWIEVRKRTRKVRFALDVPVPGTPILGVKDNAITKYGKKYHSLF